MSDKKKYVRSVMYNCPQIRRNPAFIHDNCGALLNKIKSIMDLDQKKVTPKERLQILEILKEIERYNRVIDYSRREELHKILEHIQAKAYMR